MSYKELESVNALLQRLVQKKRTSHDNEKEAPKKGGIAAPHSPRASGRLMGGVRSDASGERW